jgi:hypothetical protein
LLRSQRLAAQAAVPERLHTGIGGSALGENLGLHFCLFSFVVVQVPVEVLVGSATAAASPSPDFQPVFRFVHSFIEAILAPKHGEVSGSLLQQLLPNYVRHLIDTQLLCEFLSKFSKVSFVVLPAISDELQFSLASGGFLATIFTLGIGLAGVPAGYLLDRYSRKSVMLIGIMIYSVFTVLTALAFGFFDMAIYRGVTGVGEAMQQAALFSAVGAYFYQRRAMALGTLNFAYGLGAFFGPLFGGKLLEATGAWEIPFYIYGGIAAWPSLPLSCS